jgi:hypothetical protein
MPYPTIVSGGDSVVSIISSQMVSPFQSHPHPHPQNPNPTLVSSERIRGYHRVVKIEIRAINFLSALLACRPRL